LLAPHMQTVEIKSSTFVDEIGKRYHLNHAIV